MKIGIVFYELPLQSKVLSLEVTSEDYPVAPDLIVSYLKFDAVS